MKKLELQIEGFFEPIGFPNHGAFVAHEVRIISGNFEPFWSSFEGWSEFGRKKIKSRRRRTDFGSEGGLQDVDLSSNLDRMIDLR